QAANASTPPRWDGTTIPFGVAGTDFPSSGTTDFAALAAQLSALADTVDAVADLLVAESVHQIAQGNPLRAGATLDAIARGEAPPPELEVVRTPRTGVSVTHRVGVLLAPGAPQSAPWPSAAASPRATAEPALNAWVAGLLPDPARVRCRATVTRGGTSTTTEVQLDRKSTRLNSSHLGISYAVFCLK